MREKSWLIGKIGALTTRFIVYNFLIVVEIGPIYVYIMFINRDGLVVQYFLIELALIV